MELALVHERVGLCKCGRGVLLFKSVGDAGPEGILVERETLAGNAAEYHGADAAVADGQRFGPYGGGLCIMQDVFG